MPASSLRSLVLGLALVCSSVSQAQTSPAASADVTPGAPSAQQQAIARARVVPTQMKFDLSNYVAVVIDRNSPKGILEDSDLKPLIVPAALTSNWWVVIFIPKNIALGPPVAVYLDKGIDAVRGYVIGPKMTMEGRPAQ